MGRNLAILAVLMLGAAILLSGCSKKECEVASDCGASSTCVTYACSSENTCLKNVKPNCCGNGKCEPAGGENSCTCKDCGSCEAQGKVKYNVTTAKGPKQVESKYASYVCDNSECVVGVESAIVTPVSTPGIIEERNYFKIDLLSTMNKPFNSGKDTLSLRFTLFDVNPQNVLGSAVTITSVQVLNGNYLMGEKVLNRELKAVSETFTEEFELSSIQTLPEDEATISIKVDYSYVPVDPKGNTLQTKRSSQKVSLPRVTVIKP